MVDDAERTFYLRVLLVMYIVWVAVFTCIGRAAALLPASDLSTPLDRSIPLVPSFVWPYLAGYLYPLLLVASLREGRRINRVIVAAILANITAYAVYFLWPVTLPLPDLGRSLAERVLAAHNAIDFRPGACKLPSLHVVFVWLTYFGCRKLPWGRLGDAAMVLTAVLITVSTVLVKKHVVVDVLAGVVWAVAAWNAAGALAKLMDRPSDSAPAALRRVVRQGAPYIAGWSVLLALILGARWVLSKGA